MLRSTMQAIKYSDLRAGEKYYIDNVDNSYKIRHTGTFMGYIPYEPIPNAIALAYFENVKNCPKSSSWVSEMNGAGYRNAGSWRFYEVQKYKIEQKRDNRTLNLILRDIIGDEYFDFFV